MRWVMAAVVSTVLALGGGWWSGMKRSDWVKLAYVYQGDLYVTKVGGKPLQLTRGAGASSPRWSPDGRWLTYFTGRELWLASADGRQLHRLVDETQEGGAGQAEWSPVANTLAYLSRGGLWVVEVGPKGAGEPREVHLPAASFAWTSDGQRMAVEEPAGGPWPAERVVGPNDETPQAGVVILHLDHLSYRDLFRIPWLGEGERRPAWGVRNLSWSPDGRWITFHKLSISASISADSTDLMAVRWGGELITVGQMLAYPDWVGWKQGEPVLTYVAGVGRDSHLGKAVTLASPPEFARQDQRVITPKGFSDQGFAWEPSCALKGGASRLAVSRSGPESPKAPAIYLEGEQVSQPPAPFGDHAPRFDCQGRLSWVRISHEEAMVMRENQPWVRVDVPSWYYGHWSVDRVLSWWER